MGFKFNILQKEGTKGSDPFGQTRSNYYSEEWIVQNFSSFEGGNIYEQIPRKNKKHIY